MSLPSVYPAHQGATLGPLPGGMEWRQIHPYWFELEGAEHDVTAKALMNGGFAVYMGEDFVCRVDQLGAEEANEFGQQTRTLFLLEEEGGSDE